MSSAGGRGRPRADGHIVLAHAQQRTRAAERRRLTPRLVWCAVLRIFVRVTAALAMVPVVFACTNSDDASSDDDELGAPLMRVSLVQQRTAEGTREIGIEVTNTGSETFTVDSVHLVWSGFPKAPTTPKDTEFAPGRTVDLVTTYGEPDCSAYPDHPSDSPTAELRVAGSGESVVTEPLDARGREWLLQLYARECQGAALAAIADVRFDEAWTRIVVDGDPYLRTSIVLDRVTGGPDEPVTVESLLGSVLLDYEPARPGRPLGTLAADRDLLRIPVLIGSSGLCTSHAFGESKQTFLLSTYVRHGDAPTQRVILTPNHATQVRLLGVVQDACRD
jgi:hypothetical protein